MKTRLIFLFYETNDMFLKTVFPLSFFYSSKDEIDRNYFIHHIIKIIWLARLNLIEAYFCEDPAMRWGDRVSWNGQKQQVLEDTWIKTISFRCVLDAWQIFIGIVPLQSLLGLFLLVSDVPFFSRKRGPGKTSQALVRGSSVAVLKFWVALGVGREP